MVRFLNSGMKRRPFLQKLTILTSAVSSLPFLSFGECQPSSKPKIKFITASDGHFGQPNTDYEGSHRRLIDAINSEENVDFVVFNGDLIHDEPRFMPEVKKVYDTLKCPYHVTKGNHDRISESDWLDTWSEPADFSFVQQDQFGFILCNSSNEAGDYLCVDLNFLKKTLDGYQELSHVFLFVHISQNDWTRNGVNCQDVLDLIAQYPNVKATFHGHDHDVDGIMIHRKKPYLWSGHFGGSWGNPFPSYRVCEIDTIGKTTTYLKTVENGTILSLHSL
jgi:predicted phosphodiesterase